MPNPGKCQELGTSKDTEQNPNKSFHLQITCKPKCPGCHGTHTCHAPGIHIQETIQTVTIACSPSRSHNPSNSHNPSHSHNCHLTNPSSIYQESKRSEILECPYVSKKAVSVLESTLGCSQRKPARPSNEDCSPSHSHNPSHSHTCQLTNPSSVYQESRRSKIVECPYASKKAVPLLESTLGYPHSKPARPSKEDCSPSHSHTCQLTNPSSIYQESRRSKIIECPYARKKAVSVVQSTLGCPHNKPARPSKEDLDEDDSTWMCRSDGTMCKDSSSQSHHVHFHKPACNCGIHSSSASSWIRKDKRIP
ncbi:uncharacterized protein [Eleutherodactylus coqui]|uniref:uncharacterized protein n=1 Tax=Eleutherodactylus coqui TaxID=57060 RepID=UPI0034618AA2